MHEKWHIGSGICRLPARARLSEPSPYQSNIAPDLRQPAAKIEGFFRSHTAPLLLEAFKTVESDKAQPWKFPGLVVDHSGLVDAELQHARAGTKSSPGILD